jgi:hypothetical protein
MRVQRVVQVLPELVYGAPTPVLKDVQVGPSFVLRREHNTLGLLRKFNKSKSKRYIISICIIHF